MFEATSITLEQICPTAEEMLKNGWRLIALSVTDLGDEGFDLLYHYDKNLEIKHYRALAPKGAVVPSISGVYFTALLSENENRDLFGLTYEGLVLDFNRTLYLEECGDPMKAPFCKISTFTKLKCEV